MARVLIALLLALFVCQATGAFALVAEAACKEDCAGERDGAPCLPGCADCACCGVGRMLLALADVTPPMPKRESLFPLIAAALVTGDPQEIFHIPEPLLA